MNKKAFAITPLEVAKFLVAVLFGIGLWFIYSGVREWLLQTFEITLVGSIWTGFAIVGFVLFIVKYEPHRFIFH